MFGLLIVIGALHQLATTLYFYWTIHEFDSFMHFLGGAWIALFTLWLYFFSGIFEPTSRRGLNFLLVSLLSLIIIGVFWEAFELFFGITSTATREYIPDTVLDLIMDTLGALVACMYAYMKELDQDRNKQLSI